MVKHLPVRVYDEVLIERTGEHYRAAAIAGRRVTDVLTTRASEDGPGSIYLGRVVRRMPGLKAAFVEIGLDRPALLNLDADEPKEGQAIAVQLVEMPSDGKAARVSARLALAGRFLVLLPKGKGVVVSRRLDAAARTRLGAALGGLARPGEGVIVRAAAQIADADALAAEITGLRAVWTAVEGRLSAMSPPARVHAEDPLWRVFAAFAPSPRFVFADPDEARRARRVAASLGPDLPERIEVAPEGGALFERHDAAAALAAAEQTEVALPSGGRVRIEQTAALTAIDVDSGAGSTPRGAIVQTNLEAAEEVARQLRLRELGGLVVIDFIRMAGKGEQERVRRALMRAVETDRAAVQILGWTKGGLLELIRPRAGEAGA
jgi:ribonuclease G